MSKKGMIAEIIILAFLIFAFVLLVFIYLFIGPAEMGTVDTIRFMFDEGYSNELSTSSLLKSKYYSSTNMGNIIASYTITGDPDLKSPIKDKLEDVFEGTKVTLDAGENSIYINKDKSWDNYVIITRKIPLLNENAKRVSLWIFE